MEQNALVSTQARSIVSRDRGKRVYKQNSQLSRIVDLYVDNDKKDFLLNMSKEEFETMQMIFTALDKLLQNHEEFDKYDLISILEWGLKDSRARTLMIDTYNSSKNSQ